MTSVSRKWLSLQFIEQIFQPSLSISAKVFFINFCAYHLISGFGQPFNIMTGLVKRVDTTFPHNEGNITRSRQTYPSVT